MTTPEQDMDRSAAIKRVNETLRGPVADVLSNSMPELKGMSRTEVYEQVLDKPDLLTKVFDFFRQQRHKFRHIIRDKNLRPVLDDTVVLSCGRTLEEVIAMVVRTSAKRYFRRSKEQLTADELYEAIKDYLMHEWQVPLVPTYADMTPDMVRTLGARLLVIREKAELRGYIDGTIALPDAGEVEPPQTIATAAQPANDDFDMFLSLDKLRLRPDAFIDAMDRPDIRCHLPVGPSGDPFADFSAIFWEVGGASARILCSGLGLTPPQLGLMLITAHNEMGKDVFTRLFGVPGQPELVVRLVQQGIADGIGTASSLPDCAGFIRTFVRRATQPRVRQTDAAAR